MPFVLSIPGWLNETGRARFGVMNQRLREHFLLSGDVRSALTERSTQLQEQLEWASNGP
jgi:hypothetical protein